MGVGDGIGAQDLDNPLCTVRAQVARLRHAGKNRHGTEQAQDEGEADHFWHFMALLREPRRSCRLKT
ncbi:hypothetical protein [Variovorax sp. 54]|uniref:hypothetical protein n=1 Tax=Variovorax sp. 54 TaxID=2035212 RepID=UPI0011808A35|nr:hypothetical protein [Variovorax sp. 54]